MKSSKRASKKRATPAAFKLGDSSQKKKINTDGKTVNTSLFAKGVPELREMVKEMDIGAKTYKMKKEELILVLCGKPLSKEHRTDDARLPTKVKKPTKATKGARTFTTKPSARDKSVRTADAKINNKKNQKGNSAFLQLSTKAKDQGAQTPEILMNELNERFAVVNGKMFDPCPPGGIDNLDVWDGLKGDWQAANYVNPPYRKIKDWLAKAVAEQAQGKTSVFLIPFRIYTKYFGDFVENISFVECMTKGVCFKGYKSALPHPMSVIVFLGKGVADTPKMHGIHTRKRYIYRQALEKPHTFDNAVSIVKRGGLPKSKIHILVNHSKMGDLIADERIAEAKADWKDAFATLVPFYSYSINFTKAMKEASFVAFSSPILSNFEGEGKVRFCSVLFLFCPKDQKLDAILADKQANLGRIQVYFNDVKARDL